MYNQKCCNAINVIDELLTQLVYYTICLAVYLYIYMESVSIVFMCVCVCGCCVSPIVCGMIPGNTTQMRDQPNISSFFAVVVVVASFPMMAIPLPIALLMKRPHEYH